MFYFHAIARQNLDFIDELKAKKLHREKKSYRCLTKAEISALIKGMPSLNHLSFLILNLTTGIRPEVLKALNSNHYNQATGTLNYWKGGLFQLDHTPGGPNKHITRSPISTVGRLILSTPELFSLEQLPQVVRFFADRTNRWANISGLQEAAKAQNVKIATHRDLRTTCAKHLLQSGLHMDYISGRLGNTSKVAEKHYADNPPPDAYGIPFGPDFYKGVSEFKVAGVPVASKDTHWDGWLLREFLIECIRRKVSEFDGVFGYQTELSIAEQKKFLELLENRALTSYWFNEQKQKEIEKQSELNDSVMTLESLLQKT